MTNSKEYRHAYYMAHREIILKRAKSKYKRKTEHKCVLCWEPLPELCNGHIRYCTKCISDKAKVSRQTIWYRKNRFRLRILRRKGAKK